MENIEKQREYDQKRDKTEERKNMHTSSQLHRTKVWKHRSGPYQSFLEWSQMVLSLNKCHATWIFKCFNSRLNSATKVNSHTVYFRRSGKEQSTRWHQSLDTALSGQEPFHAVDKSQQSLRKCSRCYRVGFCLEQMGNLHFIGHQNRCFNMHCHIILSEYSLLILSLPHKRNNMLL